MKQTKTLLIALAAACALTAPAHAGDDKKHDHEAARAALARGEILPLPRILGIAAAKAPGDVLKVELERQKTGMIYELKILDRSGRVREVEIDARSGAVLKIEND